MRYLFIVLLLTSCGEDYSYGRHRVLEQEEAPLTIETFSTRLSNNLLISGKRCDGSEVETRHNETFFCQEGDFLVTVDTTNFCTPEGCTSVSVEPIIATLRASGGDSVSTFFVFDTTTNGDASAILDSVWLRVREGEAPKIVYR